MVLAFPLGYVRDSPTGKIQATTMHGEPAHMRRECFARQIVPNSLSGGNKRSRLLYGVRRQS